MAEDAYKKYGRWGIVIKHYDSLNQLLFLVGCLPIALFHMDFSDFNLMWYLFKMHIQNKGICIKRPDTLTPSIFFTRFIGVIIITLPILAIIKTLNHLTHL